MIIDFHTHAFPDDLAERAVSSVFSSFDDTFNPTPAHNGTINGLISNLNEWNIDACVLLPVITKQSQFIKLNEWSASVASGQIISFGGIFPHTKNYKDDIDFVVSLGLKGLKFHAEYQDFLVDDEHMIKIYDYALSKGLIVLHHGGCDPSFPPPYKSTPKQFARISRLLQGGIFIVAHMGGHRQWDQVEMDLAGSNVYLDTSSGFEFYSHDQFMRIVKIHGADKILFGSDSPWNIAKTEIDHIMTLPLSENDRDAILGGNAVKILGL